MKQLEKVHQTHKVKTNVKSILMFLFAAIFLFANMITPTSYSFAAASDQSETESAEPDTNTVQNSNTDNTDNTDNTKTETGTNNTAASQFESIAESAILIEASTGKILYEKNADQPMPPASITKIMTLLLTFEALDRGEISLDDEVYISEKSWLVEGSEMFLLVDTKVPLKEIITGISVVSANDGCIAVAEHISGSEEAFVQRMNERAQELGLTNTQFQNSHGLPAEGHYMSAEDIASLARQLINNHPEILEIESTTEFTYNDIHQYNRNPLLGAYPGADGLKTGRTDEAGYCLVGTAKRDDMRLISVVLKTKNESERLDASRELLDYGYKNFEVKEVIYEGESVGEADVKNGKELTVPLKADESIKIVVKTDKIDEIQTQLVLDQDVILAPIENNSKVGKIEVKLDGELLASTEVSTAQDIEKAGFFEILWRRIGNFFKSLFSVSAKG